MTSYKEGYSEQWKIFPGLPFFVRDFIFKGATKQMSTLWWAFPHFSRIFFFIHSIHEYRVGKDQILAGLRYAYAILDKDFPAVS